MREYLLTLGLELRLLNPRFHEGKLCRGTARTSTPMRLSGGWAREEATENLCLGSKAAVQERVGKFLAWLTSRKDEVRRRYRMILQSRAESLLRDSQPESPHPANVHFTLALV